MGWFPTIDVDTLTPNLSDAFWQHLLDFLRNHSKAIEKQIADCGGLDGWFKKPHNERLHMPDIVEDLRYIKDIEDLKEHAFLSDHMEHIASWLWDPVTWPIFKWHCVNGQYVINHNSGDGGYHGIEFVDGIPHKVNVRVVVERGEKL